ncbi:MAG: polysaccharide biosynthesis tyrosine autokinase [Pyrinomonadaceae bacterium]|nr:polysaccharide biosynthesis tyrosine autokinase [Pyrinomonadaceae bacterium]
MTSLPPSGGSYILENRTQDETHLRDYWRAVRKHLWLVIGITLFVTMLAAIYMARKPDIYQAQARVQVNLENAQALGAASAVIVGGSSDPAYFNTQLQILTGPGLLRRVVKTLNLENDPAFNSTRAAQSRSIWQDLQRMFGIGGREQKKPGDATTGDVPLVDSVAPATSQGDLAESRRLAPYVGAIQANLQVDPVKESRLQNRDTRLIDINFKHSDPQVAAKVVNAIADAFVVQNKERRTTNTVTTGEFLDRRIAELQSKIRNGEERLQAYARGNEILSIANDTQNIVVARLAALNTQLIEAENDRKRAEAVYNTITNRPDAVSAQALGGNAQLNEVESELSKLRQRRAELLFDYTEEWPQVKAVDEQIALLERRAEQVRGRATNILLTNAETDLRKARAREAAARADFERQKSATVNLNEAAIQYRIIEQEIATYRNLLNGLLQRSKENDVILAGTPNNILVVDYGLAPDAPVGPKRMQSIFLAFVLSIALGVALALFLEYLDDTIRSVEDVEKMLHLPALAVIPAVGSGTRRRLMPGSGASALQERNASPTLLLHADNRSSLAEAYRQLRTSVLLSTAGRAPKTLLVTSSLPSEGKTTTAVNTALSLAQTGAKVLIIDADMRRPRLHSIFEVDNSRGLSALLSTEMSEAEMLEVVGKHEASGMHLLTSGPVPPNPAELIGSEQMRRLFSVLEANYTHIVVDSPPIASFTDGVLISTMVDGVLLVLHGGKSSRDVARRSRQLLLDVGAKIFGVILNNVDLQSHDYHYYQSYYHSSYYNEDETADQIASDAKA